MIHTTLLLTFAAITIYLIRRDLTGFNHEARAGKWAVDGRHTFKEAYHDWQTKRELRRHLRERYRRARVATVRELGIERAPKAR